MDLIQKNLLSQIADLHEVPEGAYNIRANGESLGANTTANIDIVKKEDNTTFIVTASMDCDGNKIQEAEIDKILSSFVIK